MGGCCWIPRQGVGVFGDLNTRITAKKKNENKNLNFYLYYYIIIVYPHGYTIKDCMLDCLCSENITNIKVVM